MRRSLPGWLAKLVSVQYSKSLVDYGDSLLRRLQWDYSDSLLSPLVPGFSLDVLDPDAAPLFASSFARASIGSKRPALLAPDRNRLLNCHRNR